MIHVLMQIFPGKRLLYQNVTSSADIRNTNSHLFIQASTTLDDDPGWNKAIPTMHCDDDGEVFLQYRTKFGPWKYDPKIKEFWIDLSPYARVPATLESVKGFLLVCNCDIHTQTCLALRVFMYLINGSKPNLHNSSYLTSMTNL